MLSAPKDEIFLLVHVYVRYYEYETGLCSFCVNHGPTEMIWIMIFYDSDSKERYLQPEDMVRP